MDDRQDLVLGKKRADIAGDVDLLVPAVEYPGAKSVVRGTSAVFEG